MRFSIYFFILDVIFSIIKRLTLLKIILNQFFTFCMIYYSGSGIYNFQFSPIYFKKIQKGSMLQYYCEVNRLIMIIVSQHYMLYVPFPEIYFKSMISMILVLIFNFKFSILIQYHCRYIKLFLYIMNDQ